ncbi:MAG: cellulase family glycosylhydrolase [Nitrospirae bacterium]|nr:cellulase family glycosylhydrolase [Nitrospirota bacterium]
MIAEWKTPFSNGIGPLLAAGLVAGMVSCSDGERRAGDAARPSAEDHSWRFIRDDEGRALILHGTNISNSSKVDRHPRVTQEAVMRLSRDWGFNFVRYLIFWAKIEPEAGVYDDLFLDEVGERLDWFAEAGIQVVLDMHQDLWGPSLNRCFPEEIYNGAPSWATIIDSRPYESHCSVNWGLDYFSPDISRAFDNFWDYEKHPELQDQYAAMWVHVVQRLKDHPAVLGYDLMNEPWHGTDFGREREFDETKMHGFIQRMIMAIRAADNDSWIFLEPRAGMINQGRASYLPPFVDPRSGPPHLVYFPHMYLVSVDSGAYRSGVSDFADWFDNRRAEVEILRTPLAVGEWSPNGNPVFLHDLLKGLDDMTSGWAQYQYEGVFGSENDGMRRVYPQRVAGTPHSWYYDPSSREFSLRFDGDRDISAPTVIYVPAKVHFPEGWELRVDGIDPSRYRFEWDEPTETLSLRFLAGAPRERIVRIGPKAGDVKN